MPAPRAVPAWSSRALTLARHALLGSLVGAVCGGASALFLTLLDHATRWREGHPAIIYALPVAGLVVGELYSRLGASVRGGNNLVIDTLHDDGDEIPLRMAPLVLLGTVLTHLFGGSAGREGTAVQMGASLADWLSHRLRVERPARRLLLAAGVAGGFGSVFGTPVAGAVFALELTTLGRADYAALLPALAAAVVGDLTTRGLGVQHTPYPAAPSLAVTPLLLAKWTLFAVAVAAVSAVFIELTHALKRLGERHIERSSLRLALGGLVVVALWRAVGTDAYLGLGVPVIVRSFLDPAMPAWVFALKLVFTAVTVGAGFFGGEVTPLFFIGAALGNALAAPLGIPLSMAAGVGMAAVFAAASNTPLALSIMAVELLGAGVLPHVVVVSALAWLLVGHRSIYPAQRLARAKGGDAVEKPVPLREL